MKMLGRGGRVLKQCSALKSIQHHTSVAKNSNRAAYLRSNIRPIFFSQVYLLNSDDAFLRLSLLPAPRSCSALFPTVVSSSTTAPARPDPTTPFNVWVLKEDDNSGVIQHQFVNAAGQAFYIGRDPSTFCPLPPAQCPPVTGTSIIVNSGFASLDVVVPGGQQMYVCSNGALGYTQAHSASIPVGAVREGFKSTADGVFGFFGLGANGALVACPTGENGNLGTEVYQVFAKIVGLSDADVPLGNVSGCVGFDPVTLEAGVGAWQYT